MVLSCNLDMNPMTAAIILDPKFLHLGRNDSIPSLSLAVNAWQRVLLAMYSLIAQGSEPTWALPRNTRMNRQRRPKYFASHQLPAIKYGMFCP